jgi:molybdopterin converting factor small subunit
MANKVVKLNLFAELKDIVGQKTLNFDIEDRTQLQELLFVNSKEFPIFSKVLAEMNTNDEIAILPPVGGG